jgi:hypothetical protein
MAPQSKVPFLKKGRGSTWGRKKENEQRRARWCDDGEGGVKSCRLVCGEDARVRGPGRLVSSRFVSLVLLFTR